MKEHLIPLIYNLKSPKILIIGDLMIDSFLSGSVSRISPESPTPILNYEQEQFQLGGAGFVASILKQLNADVNIISICGKDDNADLLKNLLDKQKIHYPLLIEDSSMPTIKKQRIQAKDFKNNIQQLLRIDHEKTTLISNKNENIVIDFIDKHKEQYDVVVVSDYKKGFISNNILSFLKKMKEHFILIADPGSGVDYNNYSHFDYIKPNRFEIQKFINLDMNCNDNIIIAGKTLATKQYIKNSIISLDSEGLFYYTIDHKYQFVPTKKETVYDVSGAGDTIIAILALFAKVNIDISELMQIANAAARVIIKQYQPKAIQRKDLIKELLYTTNKETKLESLTTLKNLIKNTSQKILFTNGIFDEMNNEQINFLKNISLLDGIKILAVNSDLSLKKQNYTPKINQQLRIKLLSLFDFVDYIILFDDTNCSDIIRELTPHCFLKGHNYHNKEIAESHILNKLKINIKVL